MLVASQFVLRFGFFYPLNEEQWKARLPSRGAGDDTNSGLETLQCTITPQVYEWERPIIAVVARFQSKSTSDMKTGLAVRL